MEHKDNLLGVLQTLYKWKKQLLTVGAIALVGSVIISLLLPVYYKATTVFLAASPDQMKPELLFNRSGIFESNYYGNGNDIDRLLTIAESKELVELLVDSFNLYDHYDIDSTRSRAPFKVQQALFGLFDVQKTKRNAITISIEDRDKRLAARMANAAREKIDEIAQDLIKKSQLKAITTYEKTIEKKEIELKELSDTLSRLRRRFGIYNTEAQSESLTDQFAKAEAKLIRNRARLDALRENPRAKRDSIINLSAQVKGQEEEVRSLEQRIEKLNEGMPIVNILHKQYLEANQSLGEDRERYKMLVSTYESNIPATILVESATVPLIKSRPKRFIIVLATVAISLLFCVIAILLIDTYKNVTWKEITHGK